MFKIYLSLILFLIPSVLPSEKDNEEVYVFQYLKSDDLRLTPFRYRAYIRPQLTSIIQEYYQVIERFSPNSREQILILRNIKNIGERIDLVRLRTCAPLETCLDDLRGIHRQLQQLESQLLTELQGQYQLISMDAFQKIQVIDRLILLLAEMTHSLETAFIFFDTKFLNPSRLFFILEKNMRRLLNNGEVYLLISLPNDISNEFSALYRFFIVPIERNILGPNDSEFILTNVESMNHSFHEFHMRLSKGPNQFTNQQLSDLLSLHRRWNTVIRILVRDI